MVKPQRGNIHGLNPQPPAKQIHYTKRTYSLKAINTMISTSSYQILNNPWASDSQSLLSIQDVSYTSREQLPILGRFTRLAIQITRILVKLPKLNHPEYTTPCKDFRLVIRIPLILTKASSLAIRKPFLAKSSCSRQSFTHFARDFNLLQGNDLSDANDASTIK